MSGSCLCPQDVADSCRTGAATNVIFGLALGYKSCIIPTIAIGCAIYTGNSLAGMYGIATAALGMLGTLATGAVKDVFCCHSCVPPGTATWQCYRAQAVAVM